MFFFLEIRFSSARCREREKDLILFPRKQMKQTTYVMRANKIRTEIFQHQKFSNSLFDRSTQPSIDFVPVKKVIVSAALEKNHF